VEHAPIRNCTHESLPWEGLGVPKPWAYQCCLVLPVIGYPELVGQCLQAWQLQTLVPYVMVIDTGSTAYELERIRGFASGSVEVHSLRFNGRAHPSEFPAIAMDLAFAACQSDVLLSTHQDVFPRRRDLISNMVGLVSDSSPVAGYEMSPREGYDWKGMVSHTLTSYYMPVMHRIGFGWSLQRLRWRHGHPMYTPTVPQVGWPDTEILGNEILREHGIKPVLIGHESNQQRFVDENIDHFRSFVSSGLWCPAYHALAREWYQDAVRQGTERCKHWAYQRARENAVEYRKIAEGSVAAGG
jgi:hypothetical protein